VPQQITQCRQGCRIDIGGRSKPRRRTDGPVKHPSRNLHCPAGLRTAQRAAEHNLVRLTDRLMYGDAMRKPRMPGVQELTEYRPMGVLECCCTMSNGPIGAAGASARPRCRPFLTHYHLQRKNSWRHDHGQQPYRLNSQHRLSDQVSANTTQGTDQDDILVVPLSTAKNRILGSSHTSARRSHRNHAPTVVVEWK
jgi:hypothetical protein